MNQRVNEFGQPIGAPIPNWEPRPLPARRALDGRYARLEPLDPVTHAEPLFEAISLDEEGRRWTYLPYGPFEDLDTYRGWLEGVAAPDDPLFFAIVDRERGVAAGVASYLRMAPEHGVIEVGHLQFSPRLARTRAATEAMFLMMAHVFDDLGYRRYEWKCDSLNGPSRGAAERLGFVFEGEFRQAVVYRGRNRDNAWFSITDTEWPELRASFERWLAPSNFDEGGNQRSRLHDDLRPRDR
jgi:RimJ/RimL family protein N-acetyltransferase